MRIAAADRVEILELIGRYNQAIDTGNADAWTSTFTEDGVMDSPLGRAEGRDGLRRYLQERDPARLVLRHWVNSVIIDGDGDSATLTRYLNVIDTKQGGKSVITGIYNDTLRRVDGAWKFVRRDVTFDS